MSTATVAAAQTSSPDDTIRRTVRALRSAYEVDAAVLARHLGISRASLYNRLNGVAPWLAAEIVGLASFFDCEISDFYTGNVRITTGAPTGRYPAATSGEGDTLAQVVDLRPRYRGVAPSNGSSDPEPGCAESPNGDIPTGRVHDADAA